MKQQTRFKDTEIGMIPEDWKISTFGMVCTIRRGASPRPIQKYISKVGIPWVKIADATAQNTRFIEWTNEFIIEEGKKNTVLVKPGDLIVSNSATPGLPKFMKIDAAIHDGWLLIDTSNEVDKNFIYYLFVFERNRLVGIADGSVFRNLKTDIVRNHKISIPTNIEEQIAIAKIISDLDSKIELNQQMNKTLERIGQALFKHWFVDFEFPNEKGKPYKSSGGEMVDSDLGEIPKKWRVGRVDEVLSKLECGSRPKGGVGSFSEGIPSIGAENVLGLGKYDYSKTKYIPIYFFNNFNSGIIQSGDVLLYKDGAQLGRKSMFMDGFPFDKCCVNEHVFILRTNENICPAVLYFWLDQDWMTEEIKNLNTNSAQPGINQTGVNSLTILIPKKDTIKIFDSFLTPLIAKISKNGLENKELSEIRDTLLPRFMSGKIRVPVGSDA